MQGRRDVIGGVHRAGQGQALFVEPGCPLEVLLVAQHQAQPVERGQHPGRIAQRAPAGQALLQIAPRPAQVVLIDRHQAQVIEHLHHALGIAVRAAQGLALLQHTLGGGIVALAQS